MSDCVRASAKTTVLFVHQSAELYGSDRVLLYIVTGLLRRGSIWPVVVLPEKGPLWRELVAAGIETYVSEIGKVQRAIFTPRGLFRLVGRLRRVRGLYRQFLRDKQVKVVHSNTLAVLAGAVWARWERVPHLWHVHEIIESPRVVDIGFPLLIRVFADRVVANSTLTQKWFLAHQPQLRSRSSVVFNGIPPLEPVSNSEADAFRARLAAAPSDLLVVLAGRVSRLKGQALLISSLRQIQKQRSLNGIKVAIVGGAAPGQENLLADLQTSVVAAEMQDVVRFVPFVDDIRCVWQAADIAVVPSTEPESFGMVAIEAMAAGVPVIAAGHGGLLDIIEDGVSGLLFEPGSVNALTAALLKLIEDAEFRQAIGGHGRQRQQALFTLDAQVEEMEKIYLELAG